MADGDTQNNSGPVNGFNNAAALLATPISHAENVPTPISTPITTLPDDFAGLVGKAGQTAPLTGGTGTSPVAPGIMGAPPTTPTTRQPMTPINFNTPHTHPQDLSPAGSKPSAYQAQPFHIPGMTPPAQVTTGGGGPNTSAPSKPFDLPGWLATSGYNLAKATTFALPGAAAKLGTSTGALIESGEQALGIPPSHNPTQTDTFNEGMKAMGLGDTINDPTYKFMSDVLSGVPLGGAQGREAEVGGALLKPLATAAGKAGSTTAAAIGGGVSSAAEEAQAQQKSGKFNPKKIGEAAFTGAATAAGTQHALHSLGEAISTVKEKEAYKKLMSTGSHALTLVGEAEKQAQSIIGMVEASWIKEEAAAQRWVNEFNKSLPPETPLQKAQAAEMATPEYLAHKAEVQAKQSPLPEGLQSPPIKLSLKAYGLDKSKPRYRDRTPQFDNDIDKALYVIANRNTASKAHSRFMDFLKAATGLDKEELYKLGAKVKVHVKKAADATNATEFKVSDSGVLNKPLPEPKLQGAVRSVRKETGVDRAKNGYSLDEIAKHISPELLAAITPYVEKIAQAKAAVQVLTDEVQGLGQYVFARAVEPGTVPGIIKKEHPRIVKEFQAKLDKLRSELHLEQTQARKKLEAEIGTLQSQLESATEDARKKLMKDIEFLQEELFKVDPVNELFEAANKTGSYMYAIANANDFKHIFELPINYEGAINAFREAITNLKAATTVYKDIMVRSQAVFELAEEEWRQSTKNEIPHMIINEPVSHPHAPQLKGQVSMQLQRNPFTPTLSAANKEKYRIAKELIEKQAGSLVQEITYALADAGKLATMSPTDARNLLQKLGYLHPGTKAMILAATLGLEGLKTPAEAKDPNSPIYNPNNPLHYLPLAITAAEFAGLMVLFGPKVLKNFMRYPQFHYNMMFATLGEQIASADKILFGKVVRFNPFSTASYHLNSYAAQVTKTMSQGASLPDYLYEAIHYQNDGKLLTPNDKAAVDYCHELEKTLSNHMRGYAQGWKENFKKLPPDEQDMYQHIDSAVKFLNNVLNHPQEMSAFDKNLVSLLNNNLRAQFGGRPSMWALQVAHSIITGPHTIGWAEMGQAETAMIGNSRLKGIVERHVSPRGNLGTILQTGGAKQKIRGEAASNVMTTIASIYHYWGKNGKLLKGYGITTIEDFATNMFDINSPFNRKHPDVPQQFFAELGGHLATTIATDYTGLGIGSSAIDRSKLAFVYRYFAAHVRQSGGFFKSLLPAYTKVENILTPAHKLIINNLRTANWPALTFSALALWQIGGRSVIEQNLHQALWALDPTDMANIDAWLDNGSAVHHIPLIGDLAPMTQSNLTLGGFASMGNAMQSGLQLVQDLGTAGKQAAEVIVDIGNGNLIKNIGTTNEDNDAQKIHNITFNVIRAIATFKAEILGAALMPLARILFAAPSFVNKQATATVFDPTEGRGAPPLVPSEVKEYAKYKDLNFRNLMPLITQEQNYQLQSLYNEVESRLPAINEAVGGGNPIGLSGSILSEEAVGLGADTKQIRGLEKAGHWYRSK